MKMDMVNDLISRGYSILFIMDQLICDWVTSDTMEAFTEDVLTRFPNPTDTTNYLERTAPCSSTTSKLPPTNKQTLTTPKRNTHLTLVSQL